MKAYEAIERLKMDRKEFLATYGVKSHLSKLSDELVEELFGSEKKIEAEPKPPKAVDTSEDELPVLKVNTNGKRCPYTPQEIELGIRCLGNKAPQWEWRHLIEENG